MRTRQQAQDEAARLAGCLPEDLWLAILRFLPGRDLQAALCTTKAFADNAGAIWRSACRERWPDREGGSWQEHEGAVNWAARFALFEALDEEVAACNAQEDVFRGQELVDAGRRALLVGWMVEVAAHCKYDAPALHKAVQYLDAYLARKPVECLYRFQLIGIACLRAGVRDHAHQASDGAKPQSDARLRAQLEPAGLANLIVKPGVAFTANDVKAATADVLRSMPSVLRASPGAGTFLAAFWGAVVHGGGADSGEDDLFMVARFLLDISLLEAGAAAERPSLLAAGALSAALTLYGRGPWPSYLHTFSQHAPTAVAAAAARPLAMQHSVDGGGAGVSEIRKMYWCDVREAEAESGAQACDACGGAKRGGGRCRDWSRAVAVFSHSIVPPETATPRGAVSDAGMAEGSDERGGPKAGEDESGTAPAGAAPRQAEHKTAAAACGCGVRVM